MRSYTLYSHSPAETNFCVANIQVRENESTEILFERSVDSSTEEIYTQGLRKLLLDIQATLPKGEKLSIAIVNLNEETMS